MLLPTLRAQLAAAASHAAKEAVSPSSASAVQHGLVGRFKLQLACTHTREEVGDGVEQHYDARAFAASRMSKGEPAMRNAAHASKRRPLPLP